MKWVVASGKGGTGKTMVAANLAVAVAGKREVVLVDCDVEEPNLHLLLPGKSRSLPVPVQVPVFDVSRCTNCGECGKFCQYGAIVVLKDRVMFFPELCHSCGGCEMHCPEGAIQEKVRPVGRIDFSLPRPGIILISGVLNEGEVQAPRVIHSATGYADGHPLIICDAPPGMACPVVETMTGADFCILVTEPTPFGLHDLKLAAEVAKKLGVEAGVIINRSFGDDDLILEFCSEEKLPVLLTIPFDRQIARLGSSGALIVDEITGMKEKFSRLYSDVSALTGVHV